MHNEGMEHGQKIHGCIYDNSIFIDFVHREFSVLNTLMLWCDYGRQNRTAGNVLIL